MDNRSPEALAREAYALGYENESKYGACSQCTLLAIMDTLQVRNSQVFKASFGFAGGIASLSKTCGALSAGVMAISVFYGRDLEHLTTQSEDDKRRCMQLIRNLHDRYIQEYGTIECSQVHMKIFGRSFDQWDHADFQEFLRLGGHVDKCTGVVGNVASWTVEMIQSEEVMRASDPNHEDGVNP